MKAIIKIIITTSILTLVSFQTKAQEKVKMIDTVQFHVKGTCNMCKGRIENAALVKGVKWVEWDKQSEQLTVIYKTKKAKLDDIHKSIAEAGHTTDKVKCNIDAYNNLPKCCAYDSGVEKH